MAAEDVGEVQEVHEGPAQPWSVVAYFGTGGALARILPGYERRTGQMRLAAAVEEALEVKGHVLAEAGTGIGKTMAYLVPILAAGCRAVVSTYNKGLQNQLWEADVPRLRQLFPALKAAYVKGRSNYLCLLEWYELEKELMLGTVGRQGELFAGPEENRAFDRLGRWLVEASGAERVGGDLDRLDFPLPPEVRNRVTVTSEECIGKECHWYQNQACFAQRARQAAQEADIVIVNHALLLLDLILQQLTDGATSLLPPLSRVVLDEAHHLEEVASQIIGADLVAGRWAALLGRMKGTLRQVPALPAGAKELPRASHARVLEQGRQLVERAEGLSVFAASWFDGLLAGLERLPRAPRSALLERLLEREVVEEGERLRRGTRALAGQVEGQVLSCRGSPLAGMEEHAARWEMLMRQAQKLESWLGLALGQGEAVERWVRYVEREEERRLAPRAVVHVRPLSVAPHLRALLWEPRQVAAVSATLATAPGRDDDGFDFWRSRVGAPGTASLLAPSPFPYAERCRLYIPSRAEAEGFDPRLGREDLGRQEAYRQRLVERMGELLKVRQGGAFVLCTSYGIMRLAYESLAGDVNGVALRQGELATEALLKRFRQEGDAVLFATKTFWEGVDVPGEALSLVIIDKLPFKTPDEPLWAAQCQEVDRAHGGRASFYKLTLPAALVELKQAFGRLMRRMEDRGVVAILDGALVTKPYGRWLLSGLPPARVVSQVAEVAAFFGKAEGGGHARG